ncbi:hypothetical protein KEM56_001945 [Ascosphaera pollenicola]|nr:hypothetical protein KEM56_001945 [Ascosphaera pollenicola]
MTALFEKASAPVVHSVPLDGIPKRRVRDPNKPTKLATKEPGHTSRLREREEETGRHQVGESKRDEIRYSKLASVLPVTENGDIKYTTAKKILNAVTTDDVNATATPEHTPNNVQVFVLDE